MRNGGYFFSDMIIWRGTKEGHSVLNGKQIVKDCEFGGW